MKTELKLYNLWYDGTLECKAADVERWISKVPDGRLAVDKVTPSIKQYNMVAAKPIRTKTECAPLDFSWDIPVKYQDLDLQEFLMNKLMKEDHNDRAMTKRISRTLSELKAYTNEGLLHMLKCLVYVVETFVDQEVIWGVGRGSSVSSYILYLIGVHDIDCVEYDLPFSDFMKMA